MGSCIPVDLEEGGWECRWQGEGGKQGSTPELLLQESTALSEGQAEEGGRGHWVEMRV